MFALKAAHIKVQFFQVLVWTLIEFNGDYIILHVCAADDQDVCDSSNFIAAHIIKSISNDQRLEFTQESKKKYSTNGQIATL